jgi:diguanylate cyclase (GGDEF)-like protein
MAAFTSVAITLACIAVMVVAISVHEELYLDAVKKDLDGLSSNLADDLLPIMSMDRPDNFELTTALLMLDRYENVKFSVILDSDFNAVELYAGRSLISRDQIDSRLNPQAIAKLSKGVEVVNGELIAFKHIGERSLPQGYLLIINDALNPLYLSKQTLFYRVLPLTILAILISILLSSWQNYRLLLPLKKLAELAKKIKQTNDYSINLVIDGKREVKDLSDEINSMMSTIDHESTINKEYTEQLKQQQQTMLHMANFDSLTGLPNRHNFLTIVNDALTCQEAGVNDPVLLYCDLDGFKTVNDIHGHEIGDKLLIAVSKRLQHYIREKDIVSRIGGDEFLILLTQNPSKEKIEQVAKRIVLGLSEPFTINGWEVDISVSVGLSHASEAQFDADKLIATADIAMYRAKINGKNTFAIFEPGMMEANKRRLDIANAIPSAIKNEEFELYYQAKVDCFEKIVGFEALIRWTSKDLGFVSPVEFISIAEQSGRVGLITRWVISRTCRDLKQLKQKFGSDIIVALNLSANDLKDPNLIGTIHNAFVTHNVTASSIEFEVTESAFLENFDQANKFFDSLAHMGCSVALDDFGTGYSSLSYLTKIRLNTLKIDKQFIDDIGHSHRTMLITQTIVQMARNLDLKVCAEGVETLEQKALLVDMKCDQLQGYLFAKPQPLDLVLAREYASNLASSTAVC